MLHCTGCTGYPPHSLSTLLQPALELRGCLWTSPWAPLSSDFQLSLSTGRPRWEIRQVEAEQGQSVYPPHLLTVVGLCLWDKDHSFYQAALSLQLSSQGLALPRPFRFGGGMASFMSVERCYHCSFP